MIKSNNILLESNTMQDEEIDAILIDIVQEFVKPENQKQLDHQKLASSIFYSFAIGVLNNNEYEDEKIYDLQYVIEWLQNNEELLAGFNVRQ
jgi:hypothetical protein